MILIWLDFSNEDFGACMSENFSHSPASENQAFFVVIESSGSHCFQRASDQSSQFAALLHYIVKVLRCTWHGQSVALDGSTSRIFCRGVVPKYWYWHHPQSIGWKIQVWFANNEQYWTHNQMSSVCTLCTLMTFCENPFLWVHNLCPMQ